MKTYQSKDGFGVAGLSFVLVQLFSRSPDMVGYWQTSYHGPNAIEVFDVLVCWGGHFCGVCLYSIWSMMLFVEAFTMLITGLGRDWQLIELCGGQCGHMLTGWLLASYLGTLPHAAQDGWKLARATFTVSNGVPSRVRARA